MREDAKTGAYKIKYATLLNSGRKVMDAITSLSQTTEVMETKEMMLGAISNNRERHHLKRLSKVLVNGSKDQEDAETPRLNDKRTGNHKVT